jgi:hypothetical protein
MKIFFAKTFLKVGDIEFNYKKIISIYDEALKKNCNLLVFGEMALTGIPVVGDDFKVRGDSDLKNVLQVEKSEDYLEKIVDYTKDKKTKIIIGCPRFIPTMTVDEIIKPAQLFNSVVFINDGYIESVASKTTFSKNNLLNEYKFFDRENVLRDLKYDIDNYSVLLGDDIMETKNIIFLKERDSEFLLCLDTSIEPPKKQLEKLAKWTRKGLIYMNAFTYNKYQFNGEFFILNGLGEFLYQNTNTTEEIIELGVGMVMGQSEVFLEKKMAENEEFANILARNNEDKTVVYEVNERPKGNFEKNVKIISFKKIVGVEFIDYKKYINLDIELTRDAKKIIVEGLFGKCLYL